MPSLTANSSVATAALTFSPLQQAVGRAATGLALLGLLATSLPAHAAQNTERDAKAVKIAERSLEAMGGAEAWQETRFLRFEFFGFRLHHWDRHTGRHRLEGKTREGESYVVLHNVNDGGKKGGQAWLNGKALEGDDLEQWLQQGYSAWINDTYWLVMPFKLLDPGVNLSYDGEEELDNTTYDKLKLTFEGVGLTPGDTYWAFIDRKTGLMGRWAYVLQDWNDDREATVWQWLDWQDFGDLKLSSKRFEPTKEREASLGKIAIFDNLPDSVFSSADPVAGD